MIEITVEDVISGLTALVEERGEGYTYKAWYRNSDGERCTYVKDGAGDCGVGAYLINKGVPAERLVKFDRNLYAQGARDVLFFLHREGVLTFSQEAADALSLFQSHQDGGDTWGWSLSKTKEHVA